MSIMSFAEFTLVHVLISRVFTNDSIRSTQVEALIGPRCAPRNIKPNHVQNIRTVM